MAFEHAGDLTCEAAYELLNSNPSARIIDVRTQAETIFVGAPKMAEQYALIEWQVFPSMAKNEYFIESLNSNLEHWQANDSIEGQDRILLFLCRSGVRSNYAAEVATQMGLKQCYNILGGFEGDVNEEGHRGKLSGWKFSGLPWSQ